MKIYKAKLIVLRGNSGSGKSTIAQKVRDASNRKIAWVEQDYVRRKILREKEGDDGVRIALISQIVECALSRGYDVVLEGILGFSQYGSMLKQLAERCPDHHFYYFDIPFEETLRRHATKAVAGEFGRKEMEQWYKHRDVTGFDGEIVISDQYSADDAVKLIVKTAGL
jgi:predicted kinase